MAQLLGNEESKFDASLAHRLVADLNTTLVQQFLDIPVTQGRRWYSQIAYPTMLTGNR